LKTLTFLPIVGSLLLCAACGTEATASGSCRGSSRCSATPGTGGTGTGGGGAAPVGDPAFDNSNAAPLDLTNADAQTTTISDDGSCSSTGKSAEAGLAAVDIVWVVDGSGSMLDEAERLQNNMDSFTASIASAGVDTRVVLVGQNDLVPAGSALAQSGNYLFVEADVDSNNAFSKLIEHFPDYSGFLRPDAHVHFIVVSDDESNYMGLGSPQQRAGAFETDMGGLLSAAFTIHAIASPGNVGDLPCIPDTVQPEVASCCQQFVLSLFLVYPAGCEAYMSMVTPLTCPFLGGAFAPGVTYYTAADATGGVTASICTQDWTDIFSSLKDTVVASAPLPCNYEIPPAPDGMVFDRTLVNVKYTPPETDPDSVAALGNVEDASQCGDSEAWHYDDGDNPSEVLLCPAICDRVGSGAGGSVEVLFGCATIPLE